MVNGYYFSIRLNIKVIPALCYAIALISLLQSNEAVGQNRKIDSLKTVLKTAKGEQEFKILNQLGFELIDVNNNEAFVFSNRAYQLSYKYGDSLQIVKSGRRNAQILRRIDQPKEALQVLLTILPIAQRNKLQEEEGFILHGIGICYTFLAVYDKALEYNLMSLKLKESLSDTAAIGAALNNIGAVYYKIRNYEKARNYFTKSLQLKESVNDTYDRDRLLINLGLSNIHLKHFNEGLSIIRSAFAFCADNCSNSILIEGKFGCGVAYLNLRDTLQAEKLFQESFHLSEVEKNLRFQAENLVYLGKIENGRKQADKAVKYLTVAEAISDSAHYNQLLMDIYRQFINAFSISGDFNKSSEYRKKYISFKDSLVGEDMVKSFSKINTTFENSPDTKNDGFGWAAIISLIIAITVLNFTMLLIQFRRNYLLAKLTRLLSEFKARNFNA